MTVGCGGLFHSRTRQGCLRHPLASSRPTLAPAKPDSPSGARGRTYHPSGQCPVERGAARVARHVRERLLEVIPGHQPDLISKFYLMAHSRPRMRASGTASAVQSGRAVMFKAGAKRPRAASNPPAGFEPQSPLLGPSRVQGPSGSFNARWRREPGGGNTDPPEADPLRVSARKSGT